MRNKQRGVTLMELLIVIIIVGILAAVAIPSYRQYVIRSQRADAKDFLLAAATAQEKFYLQCNTYATGVGAALDCAGPTMQFPAMSKNGWYQLAITAANAAAFTIQATAVAGPQLQDTPCRTFQVTDRGIRTATNSLGADNTAECWR